MAYNDDNDEQEITPKKITAYIILAMLACCLIYLIFMPWFWKLILRLVPVIIIFFGLTVPIIEHGSYYDFNRSIVTAGYTGIIFVFGINIWLIILGLTGNHNKPIPDNLLLLILIIPFIIGFAYGVIIPFVMDKHNLAPEDMPKIISNFCKSCCLKLWQAMSRKPKAKPQ